MKVIYNRILKTSTEADSQKQAEKDLKGQFNALKNFCSAFNLNSRMTPERVSNEAGLGYFTYTFVFEIEGTFEFASIFEIAHTVSAFAHFNAFEIGEEEVYATEDED